MTPKIRYVIAQICLCSIIVKWIKTKGEIILDKNEINEIFNTVLWFLYRECGTTFIDKMNLLELFKLNLNKITEMAPIDVIKYASNINNIFIM